MDYLSICLICKDENDYLPEWLDYHIVMGVERFYIYDNQSRVSLRESLREYIQKGWVVVTEITGKAMQLHAYDHCLRAYGQNTAWLGFIDTDEFLVPKATLDLRDLLKSYEGYGGLAVSSLFFGSNGQKERPKCGQIAAYSTRTHETFIDNQLVKSIVQPRQVLFPNTPHDFIFEAGAYAVNENFLRVDNQRFPNSVQKIQLNHYFCRSEEEIAQKVDRGNAGDVRWPRARYDRVNLYATYPDNEIIHAVNRHLMPAASETNAADQALAPAELVDQLAMLAQHTLAAAPGPASVELIFNPDFLDFSARRDELSQAERREDFETVRDLDIKLLEMLPQRIAIYTDLMWVFLRLNNPDAAWQIIAQAWRLAPNSFFVLNRMTYYFLRVRNYPMAEKTAHLMLDIAPGDSQALAFLTEALIGQNRLAEAVKVGVPVIELSTRLGELPERMSIRIIKNLADYLIEQKDYHAAVKLWENGASTTPENQDVLLELANALLLQGNMPAARQRLIQAQQLGPQNPQILASLRKIDTLAMTNPRTKQRRH